MQADELMPLVSKTAALMEQFQRRCDGLEQRLQELTQQLPIAFQQSSTTLLQTLPGQVAGRVREGLDAPVADYQRRLREAETGLSQSAQAIEGQIRRLESLYRHLAWKVFAVVFGSLTLLLAGAIWLSVHYTQVIEQNQLDAHLLKLYNSADVVVCGEQLCANVDITHKSEI